MDRKLITRWVKIIQNGKTPRHLYQKLHLSVRDLSNLAHQENYQRVRTLTQIQPSKK